MIRDKWLSIFAGVLAVAAACFLGIALYIFMNPGSGSENGQAGNEADANENVTAQAAAGAHGFYWDGGADRFGERGRVRRDGE